MDIYPSVARVEANRTAHQVRKIFLSQRWERERDADSHPPWLVPFLWKDTSLNLWHAAP